MSLNPDQQQERESTRLQWARQALDDGGAQLQRASVDAGYRSYWRSSGRGQDRIVMDSPPGLEDVRPWLQMRDLLEQGGVRVPQVLARDVDAGFLLLEDLGGPNLGQVLDESNADDYFEAAISQLLRLQAITPPADLGQFGEALLERDAGLWITTCPGCTWTTWHHTAAAAGDAVRAQPGLSARWFPASGRG